MNLDPSLAVQLIGFVIAAGLFDWIKEAIKGWRADRRAASGPALEVAHVATVDESLLVVAKARDELADDLKNVRDDRDRERRIFAEDRTAWADEKREMRAEIEALSAKLRALLDEVDALKAKHSADPA